MSPHQRHRSRSAPSSERTCVERDCESLSLPKFKPTSVKPWKVVGPIGPNPFTLVAPGVGASARLALIDDVVVDASNSSRLNAPPPLTFNCDADERRIVAVFGRCNVTRIHVDRNRAGDRIGDLEITIYPYRSSGRRFR